MNQRGFMLLSAVFLTLIVSFMAALTFQSITLTHKYKTAEELTAINLADEQFAMIESLAARDNLSAVNNFNGETEDIPENFKVTTNLESSNGNIYEYKVIVTWEDKRREFSKLVRIVTGE